MARASAYAAAMVPAMEARDTAWFIYDDGRGLHSSTFRLNKMLSVGQGVHLGVHLGVV